MLLSILDPALFTIAKAVVELYLAAQCCQIGPRQI
jgi:hypothetical protein